MPYIAVTGASGFVGRRLVYALHELQLDVRAIVREFPDAKRALPVPTVAVGPIESISDWGPALDGVDTVVHLAARVHVMNDTAADPEALYQAINVEGTRRLVEACGPAGVKRFVFMSSVKAVGDGKEDSTPYREDDPPQPSDPYGRSKAEAEAIVLETCRRYGMHGIILRPPMVYGPEAKGNFLRMRDAIMQGAALPIGRLNNKRSLIYVENLVNAIVACIQNPPVDGVYFVSDGEDLTPAEMARLLGRHLGRSPRLIPVPKVLMLALGRLTGRTEDVKRLTRSFAISTEKFRRAYDWTPPFSADEGIRKTVTTHWGSRTP